MVEDYWLAQPDIRFQSDTSTCLEKIWEQARYPEGGWITSNLPVHKWEFLCWLTDHKGFLLHGSADASIQLFEPRKPYDRSTDAFSKQTAVFAAGDGIWPIFYAILDRSRPGLRFLNAALKFELDSGRQSRTYYFFSVTHQHLDSNPWREGIIYVLPRQGFTQQPPYDLNGRTVHEPHWACPKPVLPLARLRVGPEDFPFLYQVRGHDNDYVDEKAETEPNGFPWLAP